MAATSKKASLPPAPAVADSYRRQASSATADWGGAADDPQTKKVATLIRTEPSSTAAKGFDLTCFTGLCFLNVVY